ncbi:MAG: tRNA 2-selenouridine(34) synthase MnmH, partial [Bacteroidota bacterium]
LRSGAMSWLMERYGINTMLLEGGYKSYRRLVRKYFSNTFNLHIVGGMTGTGKTEILKELKRKGHQVIDLEGIAHHKGSAFGSLGEIEQPTTEQFENDLLFKFLQHNPNKVIWLENESQSIGRVFIPPELFIQMKRSRLYNIEIPFDKRIERLVHDYSHYADKDLLECIQKISKKIGGQHLNEAVEALDRKDYIKFAGIALRYYDKTYQFGISNRYSNEIINIKSDTDDASKNAGFIEKNLE